MIVYTYDRFPFPENSPYYGQYDINHPARLENEQQLLLDTEVKRAVTDNGQTLESKGYLQNRNDDTVCKLIFENELSSEDKALLNYVVYNHKNNVPFVPILILTKDGTTAHATASSLHNFTEGDYVLIVGADQIEYNGLKQVHITSETTFDFEITGDPVEPATGAITASLVTVE